MNAGGFGIDVVDVMTIAEVGIPTWPLSVLVPPPKAHVI
jgi:hypothetical protein